MSDELSTFIVTQADQFRVRALDAEAAKQATAEGDGENPNVEWLRVVYSIATEVTGT